MENIDLSYFVKENVRKTVLDGIQIGGDKSLSFMSENGNDARPLFALEFLYSSPSLIEELNSVNNADIIAIKFDISEDDVDCQIDKIKAFLRDVNSPLKRIKKPLLLRGANNTQIDKKLVPILAEYAPKTCIIAFGEEQTFEYIVPKIIERNHIFVLRTPIDINLAKEINILTTEKGVDSNRILIDPDMGGLGYGLDYGYSIIERIRQAGFDGDKMLNMPIIAFIGEESYRAKEAKSDSFSINWGDFKERSIMWEIAGATSMVSAGANIVVLWNKNSIDVLKGLF